MLRMDKEIPGFQKGRDEHKERGNKRGQNLLNKLTDSAIVRVVPIDMVVKENEGKARQNTKGHGHEQQLP